MKDRAHGLTDDSIGRERQEADIGTAPGCWSVTPLLVAENLPDLALGACHGHPCDPKNLSLGSCAAVEALLFLNWPRTSSANATLLFYRSLFGSHGGR